MNIYWVHTAVVYYSKYSPNALSLFYLFLSRERKERDPWQSLSSLWPLDLQLAGTQARAPSWIQDCTAAPMVLSLWQGHCQVFLQCARQSYKRRAAIVPYVQVSEGEWICQCHVVLWGGTRIWTRTVWLFGWARMPHAATLTLGRQKPRP